MLMVPRREKKEQTYRTTARGQPKGPAHDCLPWLAFWRRKPFLVSSLLVIWQVETATLQYRYELCIALEICLFCVWMWVNRCRCCCLINCAFCLLNQVSAIGIKDLLQRRPGPPRATYGHGETTTHTHNHFYGQFKDATPFWTVGEPGENPQKPKENMQTRNLLYVQQQY